MGRQNTIVFGSQMGMPSTQPPRTARTGTVVQPKCAIDRGQSNHHASASAPQAQSASTRQAYRSDPGPVSSRLESQWFAPTNPRVPIGPEVFEERRGWQPPPPSRGLGFAAVSLVLIGVAAAGTFFFLGPDARSSHPTTPVSTTSITNAELPATPEPATAASPETAAMTVPTVTPNDLPSAAPVVDAVKEPAPAGWHPSTTAEAPKAKTTAVAPAARRQKATAPSKPATTTAKKNEGSLPDLDRAASAAGMTPREDDAFATPGNDTPPAPTTTSTQAAPSMSATPTMPATGTQTAPSTIGTSPTEGSTMPSAPSTGSTTPSEVMPDLQIKR